MMRHRMPLLLLLCLLVSTPGGAVIQHTVTLQPERDHMVSVVSRHAGGDEPLELMMATWTPGSYLIREFSRHLEGLEASQGDEPRRITKLSKNRWRIERRGRQPLVLRYRIYARELTVRTSFVDSGLALLNGTTLFLVPVDGLDQGHRVRLELPEHWEAYSALERDKGSFVAGDFHELVDSPIVAGQAVRGAFEIDGIPHHLVSIGDARFWDLDRAVQDVSALSYRHYLFWGELPFRDDYWFFNLITDAGGGLEHRRSTVLMANRWDMRRREDYLDWLALVSHEYFHAWNVKALRPRNLAEYDYENELYTRHLWFSEGLTSYYATLLLARAGLMRPEEYLKKLAERIRDLELKPGRFVRSVADASFDAWIKHYRPDENSPNVTVSYYNKGAVLGFLLDAELRRRSDGRYSLDDLMRTLYARYADGPGFSEDDVVRIASGLAGESLEDWFARYIQGTDELRYEDAMSWYGLELVTEELPDPTMKAPKDPPPASLGVVTREAEGRLLVGEVLRNSPAHRAGINAEDEILALAGVRVLPEDWSDRLRQLHPGDQVEVLLSRRGTILERSLQLEEAPAESWTIRQQDPLDAVHRQRLASWLGEGWYPDEGR